MVSFIGKCSLLIIILEFEEIDISELNTHQVAALRNLSESACQIGGGCSSLLVSVLACLEVCTLED